VFPLHNMTLRGGCELSVRGSWLSTVEATHFASFFAFMTNTLNDNQHPSCVYWVIAFLHLYLAPKRLICMKKTLVTFSIIILAIVPAATFAKSKTEIPEYTVDGLKLLPNNKNITLVWAEPGTDLSQYNCVCLVEPYAAFKKNWQRDQNRGSKRVCCSDIERIKGIEALRNGLDQPRIVSHQDAE